MRIALVYSVAMSKINLQIKGQPAPVSISASSIEQDLNSGRMVLKDEHGKKLGEFSTAEVVGWWLSD